MVRKASLLVLTILAMAGWVIFPHTAAAVSLKQTSVVTGDTITLGDVFNGLPANNEKVLGLAPQPGQEMVLNARTLLRIAVAMDLPWRPINSTDHVVLTRAASVVDRDMIEEALRMQLSQEGIDGKYKIIIPDSATNIVMPHDVDPGLEITDMNIKHETGWFEASVAAPSAANPVHTSKITGTVQKIVDVPVLKSALKPGDVIGERDISYIEMSEKDLRSDMVINADEIIGMTPRRLTPSDKPIKALDLEPPQVISRGDVVTMVFNQGPLMLTASGKAMQNGAKGDLIRVLNTNSNKTIEAFVTADKEVTVKEF